MDEVSGEDGVKKVTPEDIDAFIEKLKAWGQGLPAADQAVLAMVLTQATGPIEDEVSGFAMDMGLSALKPVLLGNRGLYRPTGLTEGGTWAEVVGPAWFEMTTSAYPAACSRRKPARAPTVSRMSAGFTL